MAMISMDTLVKFLATLDPEVNAQPNRFSNLIEAGATSAERLRAELQSADPAVRADAAEALGIIADHKAVALLKQASSDPEMNVRTAAAVALIRIGDEELLGQIAAALEDPDPAVVAGAAAALGQIADPRVVPNLLQAFRTENTGVGSAVAWALGQIGAVEAVPWLVAALENHFVPANACEALGRIGDPTVLPALIAALDEPNDDVRAYAARAVGQLIAHPKTTTAAATTRFRPKANLALNKLLNDRSPKVRAFAAIALVELGSAAAARAIVAQIQTSKR